MKFVFMIELPLSHSTLFFNWQSGQILHFVGGSRIKHFTYAPFKPYLSGDSMVASL